MIIEYFLGKFQRWSAKQQREELTYFLDSLKGMNEYERSMVLIFATAIKNTILKTSEYQLAQQRNIHIIYLNRMYKSYQKNNKKHFAVGIAVWLHTLRAEKEISNRYLINELWSLLLNSSEKIQETRDDLYRQFNLTVDLEDYDKIPEFLNIEIKNIKSSNDDDRIYDIMNEMEIKILSILRSYKNNNFKRKSDVENWAQSNGLSFLENPHEKQLFEMSFYEGNLKEKIDFSINLNINKLINFQLQFFFYEEFYGLSGVVSPNSDIFLNVSEIQIKYSTGKNYARELFYKFLKQEDIKDINQIFKN